MIIPIKRIITEALFDVFDGKTTVYHGTSPVNKKRIQAEGLLKYHTGAENSATNILKSIDQDTYDKSLDKTYTTNSRWSAAKYAGSHLNGERITGLSDPIDILKTIPNTFKSYITGKGIVKMRIPKDFINKNEVLNPELKSKLDPTLQPIEVQFAPNFIRNYIIPRTGVNLFGSDRVFKDNIPTNFISGSKDYNTNTTLNGNGIKSNIKDKIGAPESKYSKIKNNFAMRGSNVRVRRLRSNANLVNNGLNAVGILGTGAIGNHLMNNDPTKVDQFIDTLTDK